MEQFIQNMLTGIRKWVNGKIADINAAIVGKQDALTAGANIEITSGGTISATDTTYSAGSGITISGNTISTIALAPASGYNYATKYIDDDTGLEGTNVATGNYSNWAEGSKTTATSIHGGNHAEGYTTQATGQYGSHSEGTFSVASGDGAHAEGVATVASGTGSHAEGQGDYYGIKNVASGPASHVEGSRNNASGHYTHAEGAFNIAQNFCEHTQGAANVSHSSANNAGSEWQGDASHTLHSIGYGRYTNERKNAVEVMQNADVYIKGIGGYDGVHIKGQDSGITVQTVQEVISGINTSVAGKQDTLTAGANIEITSAGTISVTGIINDSVSGNNSTYSSGKILELVNAIKQFKIEVVAELPASGETHTIYLVPSQESGATNSRDEYLWIVDASTGTGTWELIGSTTIDFSNYYTKTEVDGLLDDKQDTLTAGTNIEITSAGTINVTGITNATEQALEEMSYVVSSHINELTTKVDGKQDEVTVSVQEVLDVLNGSNE